MKITCFAIVAAIIIVPVGLKAVPLSFCRSSSDVKEYIVDSITNYIRSCDKRYTAADYDAASKRCPKLLKPVKEFKTEIGKRLKSAMEAGGMLPKK